MVELNIDPCTENHNRYLEVKKVPGVPGFFGIVCSKDKCWYSMSGNKEQLEKDCARLKSYG